MRETLEFANAMAALNCTKLGARGGIATAAEARALIERGERRANKDFAAALALRMIPLRSTERIYSTAVVTAALIAINTLIFLYQVTLGPGELNTSSRQWGIVPDQMRGLGLVTLVTSMFLTEDGCT